MKTEILVSTIMLTMLLMLVAFLIVALFNIKISTVLFIVITLSCIFIAFLKSISIYRK